MKENIGIVIFISMLFILANTVRAEVLTFEDRYNLGVTLDGAMAWVGDSDYYGGDHLYMTNFNLVDYINFHTPTYLNDFQMTGIPWPAGYPVKTLGFVDIEASGSDGTVLWSNSVNLSAYDSWDKWLTVSVEQDNVKSMKFYLPEYSTRVDGFWPSIDNIRINESATVTPEPASMLLFGFGGAGLGFFRRLKRKKKEHR